MRVRISEQTYQRLREATATSFLEGIHFPPETGCILLLGHNNHPTASTFLVADVLEPNEGDIQNQENDGLVFSSDYLRRALLTVRKHNLSGFFTVHTHPFSDKRVWFSSYDDLNDPSLMDNLYDLKPDGVFGSLVLGKESATGRVWYPGGQMKMLQEMIVVGERLNQISLNGHYAPEDVKAAEIFDSSLAITGNGPLAKLRGMRVGVVGASGTGSIVIELLARAGVGEIVIFEFDVIKVRNLNRILHSRQCDASDELHKASRMADAINELGMDTRVNIVDGTICDNDVALELRGCDFIFGCVDADWPRLIMSELCYQYLIPYIDLGTEIGMNDTEILSLDSRVSFLSPDRPCLLCTGIISAERIRLESMGAIELGRILNMGYSKDFALNAPAVMELNMRAASFAVLVLRHLLGQFLETPVPTHIKEALTNYSIRPVRLESDRNCLVCGSGRIGTGDSHKLTTR